jgi:hypothetical protein
MKNAVLQILAIWIKADENHLLRWNAPWSQGFPGGILNVLVMSTKYLGERFDNMVEVMTLNSLIMKMKSLSISEHAAILRQIIGFTQICLTDEWSQDGEE